MFTRKYSKLCIIALLLILTSSLRGEDLSLDTEPVICTTKKRKKLPGDYVWELIKDSFILNKNLFHPDSFKILVTSFPVIVSGYMIDNAVHKNFYQYCCHKNVNQLSSGFHKFCESWIVPLVGSTAAATILFARDENLRQTSRAFLLGLPFVILVSDLLKMWIKVDICYRPFNERFYRERSVTGFPSTHAAQITYAAILYGMRLGPAWGVPLGLLDVAMAISCINDNRHFISQYIGGMALGALYAFAADKLVRNKLQNLDISVCMEHKKPMVKVGFNF